ncbi:acyltransferase [Pimelobacter simplex]|uniref:acyltransferase n=1 Tax=Nocardioides simplex TaxID=2045 RepID=UPI003AAF834F
MRQALTTLVFLLPPSKLKNRLLRRLGHAIPDTAVVGINLVRRVDRFELGEGSLIHHFNMFRDLRLVKLGVGCRIMLFNQVVGDSGYEPGAPPTDDLRTLRMGDDSHIISQHYFDCGGGIILGDNAWVTGIRSTLLSHAFDPTNGGVILDPVTIGDRAVIATSCTMLPGTVVGEGALIAAGSTTWTGQEAKGAHLHGGVPARRLAPIDIPRHVYDRARYQGPRDVVGISEPPSE